MLNRLVLGLCLALSPLLAAIPASAAFVATMQESGSDVVVTGSGSLDVTNSGSLPVSDNGFVNPSLTDLSLGLVPPSEYDIFFVVGSGPTSFGSGGSTIATSGTGDRVGVGGSGSFLRVPLGYVSGSPLSATATFAGQTFASLGVTLGTYVWTWGSGGNADSFTLIIEPQSVTITVQESGPDVLVSGSGSLNLTGLTFNTSGGASAQVAPSSAVIRVGAFATADFYNGASGTGPLGPGSASVPSTTTGALFGIAGTNVAVPAGYLSGDSLSGQSTYSGESLASLGLTPGTYVSSWGAGAAASSITVHILSPPPVPSLSLPALALVLLLLSGLGIIAIRRRTVTS